MAIVHYVRTHVGVASKMLSPNKDESHCQMDGFCMSFEIVIC